MYWGPLAAAACYGLLWVGWSGPWLAVGPRLEPFGLALLVSLHAVLLAGAGAAATFLRASSSSALPSSARVFGVVGGVAVGARNWRSYGLALLCGLAACWSASLGAVLRLFEMAALVHVGPVAPASDLSPAALAALIAAEMMAALALPMFGAALHALVMW